MIPATSANRRVLPCMHPPWGARSGLGRTTPGPPGLLSTIRHRPSPGSRCATAQPEWMRGRPGRASGAGVPRGRRWWSTAGASHGVVTRMRRSPRARVLAPMLATAVRAGRRGRDRRWPWSTASSPARTTPTGRWAGRTWTRCPSADGAMTLRFISTRGVRQLLRVSARTATRRSALGPTNFNPAVTDGLYPFACVNNSDRRADGRRGALRGGPPGLRRRDRRAVRLDAVRPRPRPGDQGRLQGRRLGRRTGSATRGCASRSS